MPARPPSGLHSGLDPILAGLAGAVAMTLIHEVARRIIPEAPRLDSLGRRALARLVHAAGRPTPDYDNLQAIALAGDVVFNAGLFAAVLAAGPPTSAPARGALVGALAGLATLGLPPVLGIGPEPDDLPLSTQAMTLGLYSGGGLVAGLAYRRFGRGGTPS